MLYCKQVMIERNSEMATTINVSLPEPLARIYENASAEDQRKAQWLMELVLRDLFSEKTESLMDVVNEISQQAKERGLTQEVLDDILLDDDE